MTSAHQKNKLARKVSDKKRDDPEQSRRFIKDANELEADDDDASVADSVIGWMGSKPNKPHK